MADTHSKEERSINMSHIRSKNTKPEVLVGKYLFSRGLRYRKLQTLFLRSSKQLSLLMVAFGIIMIVEGLSGHQRMSSIGVIKSNQMLSGMSRITHFCRSRAGKSLSSGNVS